MTNLPPYSTLDPRIQRTLDILYQSFNDLLKERHYKYIKIQEITRAAKINRATFYNHFENKSDFIIFCAREGFRREITAKFPLASFEYTEENLFKLIVGVFGFMITEFEKWHFQWDEMLYEKALKIELYYYLVDWIKISEYSPNSYPFSNVYALGISTGVIGTGLIWCENGCIEPIEELSENLVHFFESGLPGLRKSAESR